MVEKSGKKWKSVKLPEEIWLLLKAQADKNGRKIYKEVESLL